LAHERLSFDPSQAVPVDQRLPTNELVEILLIENDLDDIRLAKLALEENHIHSGTADVAVPGPVTYLVWRRTSRPADAPGSELSEKENRPEKPGTIDAFPLIVALLSGASRCACNSF
jgi:hypothetical protein